MSSLPIVVPILYQIIGILLMLYGGFILLSVLLFLFHRRRHDWAYVSAQPDEWPTVTVQLPIYNEPRVAERVVTAVANLDYPADRLQIQVLDDSTDHTTAILARHIAHLRRERGLDISHHRRGERSGYKAGALASALPYARGEFIAIFDADFVPGPDWLRRTIPALLAHPELAFVQTRWGHLNRSQNLIAAAQGIALDGHFVVEQQARSASGFMQNFNGSGGIWRRRAIEQAGGWTSDTVTEDLDLSYRAQLAGWRGAYIDRIEAPAELPPMLTSYKRQQHRWAKGSVQTLRKLARHILRSNRPLSQRLYALVHLGGYLMVIPLLLLLVLTLPLALLPEQSVPLPFVGYLSSFISAAPFLMFALAQYRLDGVTGLRRLWQLPILALFSLGLSPTVAKAALAGLSQKGGAFNRTPKQGRGSPRLAMPEEAGWPDMLPEAAVFLYAFATLTTIIVSRQWHLAPLPLLYLLGSGAVFFQSLNEYALTAGHRPHPTGLTRPVHSGDGIP
ncbi:MAG: glycosyltransferase [Caldilineae bacterium]|nr:MAG: glycosyltransferase [Caldilineae bacterium]